MLRSLRTETQGAAPVALFLQGAEGLLNTGQVFLACVHGPFADGLGPRVAPDDMSAIQLLFLSLRRLARM